jgi:hypothetical protein
MVESGGRPIRPVSPDEFAAESLEIFDLGKIIGVMECVGSSPPGQSESKKRQTTF